MTTRPAPFSEDLARVKEGDRYRVSLSAEASDARALALAALELKEKGQRVLVICADPADVPRLREEMTWFVPGLSVRPLPDWETLPYDVLSPQEELVSERLETLYRLTAASGGADVLLASAITASQRLAPVSYVGASTFFFRVGEEISIETLKEHLARAGYAAVKQVLAAGEFAVRGSIVDVFPMGSERPFRLDLFDNEIETIRWFDVETQRSMEDVKEIRILPGHEFPVDPDARLAFRQRWRTVFTGDPKKSLVYSDIEKGILSPGIEYYLPLFFDETAVLADYLPADTRVFLLGDTEQALKSFGRDMASRAKVFASDPQRPALPPEKLWQTPEEFFTKLGEFARFTLARPVNEEQRNFLRDVQVDRKSQNPVEKLLDRTAATRARGWRTLISASSPGRLETMSELFRAGNLKFTEFAGWEDFAGSEAPLGIAATPVYSGSVESDEKVVILTETELYASSPRRQRLRRARHASSLEMMVRDIAELKTGDAVVHIDHGIGRYRGLVRMDSGGAEAEFLEIEYKNEAKLYVPITNLQMISRYAGADPEHAPLHALGRGDWEKARRKAAEEVRDTAADLLNLYALRRTREGLKFKLSPADYQAFCQGFSFDETPDQAKAIEAVVSDMTSGKPMDRLVCGDVGFGKTEVALRAAFVAAMDGRQVAVLCPTTLLAEQHAATFRDRFRDWPVQIAELSRFRTGRETMKAIEGIAEGTIDIVIGTHKLFSEKVNFKNLGLVIIDEEHRFGVRQKEILRKIRAEVDVLTLTATPIPRTLSMSLEGIRDFSVIATAPERRLPVKTFVRGDQDGTIREAILRELKRGGQVYFLHNEVETMENALLRLGKLVPEARIGVAHGQMSERELERVMREFYQQRFNLLLCSTIIETGIDIPSANTIIIERADKLGLAQLHQLRGRVGRSHHQAYAYLLTPPDGPATKQAKMRLEAIQELEDLGSGFYLAMHDLEIRGAGEVLGERQSGEIAEVGFELYNRMLAQAVKALKRGEAPSPEGPLALTTDINLHAPALLPSAYVPDVSQRLAYYKAFASAEDRAALENSVEALVDCYGKLPDAAKRLIEIHKLRMRCEAIGIRRIDAGPSAMLITFTEKPNIEPLALIRFLQSKKNAQMLGPAKLKIRSANENPEARLSLIHETLGQLTSGK
ncbi:transcription-repair coupling factor [Sutterella sp.]|uniref:transcription-repair coupling factor n=1 Tax=Sutterella sp. TaxID=1981025 RepID=UPI0026DF95BB|nr:transcription-repair coupling factor [Sutterella sp.]MDO5531537.1 transcription-repair coupling factor [Sutterella sp.]